MANGKGRMIHADGLLFFHRLEKFLPQQILTESESSQFVFFKNRIGRVF